MKSMFISLIILSVCQILFAEQPFEFDITLNKGQLYARHNYSESIK